MSTHAAVEIVSKLMWKDRCCAVELGEIAGTTNAIVDDSVSPPASFAQSMMAS